MPVKIHGKEYKTVAERVVEFHAKKHENKDRQTSITTEIIKDDGSVIIVKATINILNVGCYTGHAEEVRGSTMINETSALENAETSAIGRALASYGLGGNEFASAEEVANAIAQQKSKKSASKGKSSTADPRQTPPPPGRASNSFGEGVLTFGKHKGKHVSEIPKQYLEWLTSRKDTDDLTHNMALDEINRREQKILDAENSGAKDDLEFLDPKKEVKVEPKVEVEVETLKEIAENSSNNQSPSQIHEEKQRLAEVLTGLSERMGWKEFTNIKQQELGAKGFKECSIDELTQLQSVLEGHLPPTNNGEVETSQTELLEKVLDTFDGEVIR